MEFGEQLRLLRKTEGYTQKKLAKLLDSSEIGIRLYETGKRNPNGKFLKNLCKAFPEYMSWIMTGDSETMPQVDPHMKEKERVENTKVI